jgi:hypothetical protein
MPDVQEHRWAALEAEWLDVLESEATAVAKRLVDAPGGIAGWTTALDRMCAEQDALLRGGQWVGGPDDVLSILGRSRHETYHSALLAWLLDPQARHGFGAGFLAGVLRHCVPEAVFLDLERARSDVEVTRGDTRADIVVFGPQFTLVIENKVNAGEQHRQCDRLHARFQEEVGALFLFLSPTGRAPETATGAAAEAFQSMRYAEIATLLGGALRLPEGKDSTRRGRETASNYLATLEKEFR